MITFSFILFSLSLFFFLIGGPVQDFGGPSRKKLKTDYREFGL